MPASEMSGAFEDLGEESGCIHSCTLSLCLPSFLSETSPQCTSAMFQSPGFSEFKLPL